MTSEKNIGITHANHSATSKAILTKMQKCTCKLNVYIFYFCFKLGIIHGDRCDRKTPKTFFFIKVSVLLNSTTEKGGFSVIEFSNTDTF